MAAEVFRKLSFRRKSRKSKPSVGENLKSVTFPEDMPTVNVQPFAYTYDPTIAWELLKARQPVKSTKTLKIDARIRDDQVRFVCISDTHDKHRKISYEIPDGDVLIVAGDFTTCGHPKEIEDFNRFLGSLPHRYKIIIAGNHELTFDPKFRRSHYMVGFERVFKNLDRKSSGLRATIEQSLEDEGLSDVRELLTNCIYLEDCAIEVYGIKIYGTPWQPAFDNWAFNLPRGQACLDKWNMIPPLVDVLITHSPPIGHGDLTRTGVRAGCVELLNSVRARIRPKFHVFGHIHEGYGATTDGYTKFINCCVCNCDMKPVNLPILFDVPLPAGYRK